MKKFARYSLLLLFLSTFAWLTACEWTLSGSKRATVLEFSEAATDNLFAGLIANDYAVFSRDFDSDMNDEISAADFAGWKQGLDNQLGNYLSREIEQVTRADEFYVVTYRAKFERAEPVTISVAFHASDESIAALSFDSEEFSWSPFQERR